MTSSSDVLVKIAAMPEEQQLVLARILSSAMRIVEELPEDEIARRLELLSSIRLTEGGKKTVKEH